MRLRAIEVEGCVGIGENKIGAGDRDRTGDIQLGKLTFYH